MKRHVFFLAALLATACSGGTTAGGAGTSPSGSASASAPTSTAATTASGTPITLSVKLDGAAAPVTAVVAATFDADGKTAHYNMGTKGDGTSYSFLINLGANKAISSADLALADLGVVTATVGGLADGKVLSWTANFSTGFKNMPTTLVVTPNGGKLDLSGTLQLTPVLGGGKGQVDFEAKGLPTS